MHIVKDTPEIVILTTSSSTMLKTDTKLKNDYCSLSYDEVNNEISGLDFCDAFNIPSFFTKRKRGVKKAWQELTERFDEQTKYGAALDIIACKVRVHSYCAMD